jgi:hypothetical protein
MTSVWVLEPSKAWGDYGRILEHGISRRRRRVDGRLQLERVGPDIAPVTLPASDVIVTDAVRIAFEAARLPGLSFHEVDRAHVPRLDWSHWDRTAKMPPVLPPGGEPEAFILDAPHDEAAADALGPLWELELPQRGRIAAARSPGSPPEYRLDLGDDEALPIFRAEEGRSVLVDAAFLERFAELVRACVARPVIVGEIPGGAPQRRLLGLDEPVPEGYYATGKRSFNPFTKEHMKVIAPIAEKPWWRFW